jgi:hypothetical protein
VRKTPFRFDLFRSILPKKGLSSPTPASLSYLSVHILAFTSPAVQSQRLDRR